MIEILTLLILSTVGATFIITRSFLFECIREKFTFNETLYTLFSCPQCLSFWCNLLFSLFLLPIINVSTYFFIVFALFSSFASSGVCYIISSFIDKE